MGKGMKNGHEQHKEVMKERAKNRVDDLQGMFCDLQSARKESRSSDVALLEEQVNQMLREWQSELNHPSPASSFQGGGSLGSFSTEIGRLLQLCEEEDDATSGLPAPKPEPDMQKVCSNVVLQQDFCASQMSQQHGFALVDQCKDSPSGATKMRVNNMDVPTQFDYNLFDMHKGLEQTFFTGYDNTGFHREDALPQIASFLPSICPPPSAFLGPKCALWDCTRPEQGWNQDYCSSFHGALAPIEGRPGMTPVLRPGGIGLKDNLLFSALKAKTEGKDVGVPNCEGAATAKAPWNAPELFDLLVLEGETIREWLFFDKPRRAFESGNRKQRSLPDYEGRGWHESRKQVMNEFGGLKRSYYMDPQPMKNLEWHLYEYEISKCDAFALYRLELKLVDGKKSPKGKVGKDSVAHLQKQMRKLSAVPPSKPSIDGKSKSNLKDGSSYVYSASNHSDVFDYGASEPYNYLIDDLSGYYPT